MAAITFTRGTDALGRTEYRHETARHRFLTTRNGRGWETEVWTVKTVGTVAPVIVVRDRHLETIGADTLGDAREDIAAWIARRG